MGMKKQAMSKDYAKRVQSKRHALNKPKVYRYLALVVLVLAASFSAYRYVEQRRLATLPPVEEHSVQVSADKHAAQQRPLPQVQFEFYDMLPKMKVDVDEPKQSALKVPLVVANTPGYWLQAGAFFARKSAESLQERLALLGVDSVIGEKKSATSGQLMYYVQVGPFVAYDLAKKRQADLKRANVETFVHKVSG
jgi:cell division protein FtsN